MLTDDALVNDSVFPILLSRLRLEFDANVKVFEIDFIVDTDAPAIIDSVRDMPFRTVITDDAVIDTVIEMPRRRLRLELDVNDRLFPMVFLIETDEPDTIFNTTR